MEGAEREARFIEETGALHPDALEKIIEFSRNFTDRCHHTKEEKHLFCKMGDRGVPCDAGPIAVMLIEHEEGRRIVRQLAERLPAAQGGEAGAIAAVRDGLFAYVELLRAHIAKEDEILFPMADQILESEDQRQLTRAFDAVEAEEMGAGVHEKYHRLAHELADRGAT